MSWPGDGGPRYVARSNAAYGGSEGLVLDRACCHRVVWREMFTAGRAAAAAAAAAAEFNAEEAEAA